MHARLAVARNELPRALRIAIAAGLSWWIARLLGADRPVFAVIVPMVAIRDDTYAALSLSLGRMLGVMAGVVLGIAVVAVAGVSTSAVVLLLVVGLALGLFLRTGPELNTQIAISALLVLIVTKNANSYARRPHLGDGRRLGRVARGRGVRAAARSAPRQRAPAGRDRAGAGRRPLRSARDAHARRPLGARPARRRRRARARRRTRRRGSAEGAARAAHEPPAPRLAHASRRHRQAAATRPAPRDPGTAAGARHRELRPPRGSAGGLGRRGAAPAADHRRIAAAVAEALAGEGCSHEVAEARELIAAYQRDDSRPISAILRRPLVLLADELSGPSA